MNATCFRVCWGMLGGLLLAGVALSSAVAQQVDSGNDEAVVQFGPDDPLAPDFGRRGPQRFGGAWLLPGEPFAPRPPRPLSPYYIGVVAGPVSDAVRAHVELPDGAGLMVTEVFDGSPADEAELAEYDILVRAGERELQTLDDLIDVVDQHAGEVPQQFTLDILRRGRAETVWVTPAARPEPDRPVQPGFPEDRLQLNPGNEGFFLRPGLGFDIDQLPANVSIQLEREADGPAKITVERDGARWVVEVDDPATLQQLPEDLRPIIASLLERGPRIAPMPGGFGDGQNDLPQRVDEMERQLRELQQRLRREER